MAYSGGDLLLELWGRVTMLSGVMVQFTKGQYWLFLGGNRATIMVVRDVVGIYRMDDLRDSTGTM